MDPASASRISFAVSITLHYLFPMLTMGGFLGLFALSWGRDPWPKMARVHGPLVLFTLLGITTGFAIKWHFQAIWTTFYTLIKDLWGSVLGMEARISLLGFLVFFTLYFWAFNRRKLAWIRVASLGLFLTTLVSATVIVALNSWMQFPSGIRIMNNPLGYSVETQGLYSMFFSPTFPTRYVHVLLGAGLLGGSWVLWKSQAQWRAGLWLLFALWLGQFVAGHWSAKVSYQHQPEKFAVFEGHEGAFEAADLWLYPSAEPSSIFKLKGMLSYLLYQDASAPIYGTNAWKEGYLTDMKAWTFKSYHLMVLGHFTLLALLLLAGVKARFGKGPKLQFTLSLFVLVALLSNIFGWYTAELGRQPWMIRGLLTVKDAAPDTASLAYTGVVYMLLAFILPLLGWWIGRRFFAAKA